jgi:Na+-translocating ferredoxin:NAD+ oxidoreductase RNF subunit RnfB
MSNIFKHYAVYYNALLYPVIKSEFGNKKVADPRDKHIEQILPQKWCPNCRKRGCWRALSDDEARWD